MRTDKATDFDHLDITVEMTLLARSYAVTGEFELDYQSAGRAEKLIPFPVNCSQLLLQDVRDFSTVADSSGKYAEFRRAGAVGLIPTTCAAVAGCGVPAKFGRGRSSDPGVASSVPARHCASERRRPVPVSPSRPHELRRDRGAPDNSHMPRGVPSGRTT